ncbi:MAG: aldose 1-epimerase family protein [Oscillospiraceae bacterium]|nr:aldose 1-epimerase family protein [Oscillospiraceae bacterium]
MQVTISSKNVKAVIDSFGAELHSLKNSSGTEYLWQADPKIWKRHAPILFPFICNTTSKKYTCGGKEYSLANHGFARDSEFELLYSLENEAGFVLRSSEETKKLYPFDFELYVKYAAVENMIGVNYIVKNIGDKDIYFFIGGHPAFNVPDFDDYYVQYEKPEKINREFNGKTSVIADNTDSVDLSHALFSDDVFMKDKPESAWIALVSKTSGQKVKLTYDNRGCIAVWSSYFDDPALTEQAKFVCLEPWSSVPVYCDNEEELTKMEHAIKLEAGKSYFFSYFIEVS